MMHVLQRICLLLTPNGHVGQLTARRTTRALLRLVANLLLGLSRILRLSVTQLRYACVI